MLNGLVVRPTGWALRVAGLLSVALVVSGCAQVGTQNITFWDIAYSITFFFFWLVFIWMFVALFTDVVRRDDLSGWSKAGWIILMLIVPFIGILFYIATRPRGLRYGTEETGVSAGPTHSNAAPAWPTNDLDRLAALRASGAITEQEFDQLRASKMTSTPAPSA